jgi:hypothetical protein
MYVLVSEWALFPRVSGMHGKHTYLIIMEARPDATNIFRSSDFVPRRTARYEACCFWRDMQLIDFLIKVFARFRIQSDISAFTADGFNGCAVRKWRYGSDNLFYL